MIERLPFAILKVLELEGSDREMKLKVGIVTFVHVTLTETVNEIEIETVKEIGIETVKEIEIGIETENESGIATEIETGHPIAKGIARDWMVETAIGTE